MMFRTCMFNIKCTDLASKEYIKSFFDLDDEVEKYIIIDNDSCDLHIFVKYKQYVEKDFLVSWLLAMMDYYNEDYLMIEGIHIAKISEDLFKKYSFDVNKLRC